MSEMLLWKNALSRIRLTVNVNALQEGTGKYIVKERDSF